MAVYVCLAWWVLYGVLALLIHLRERRSRLVIFKEGLKSLFGVETIAKNEGGDKPDTKKGGLFQRLYEVKRVKQAKHYINMQKNEQEKEVVTRRMCPASM